MSNARQIIQRELNLEAEAQSLGALNYRQNRTEARGTPGAAPALEEANLPPGQQLLRKTIEPTAALLREKIAAAAAGKAGKRASAVRWLENASPEAVAYLAGRVALNAAVTRAPLQKAALQLGEAIIDHVQMVVFSKKNKAGYIGLQRSQHGRSRASKNRLTAIRKLLAKEGARENIASSEKLQLGAFALDALIEATGFFREELMSTNGRVRDKRYILRPTEIVEKWLEREHARCELLNPKLMPMVVRPRRWRSPNTGGYLRRVPGRPLVDALGKDYQDRLAHSDLSPVYEAINHIQETPWAINADVLAVMREIWDGGGTIAGLPPRDDDPLPAKPADIDTNEDAKAIWKREAAQVHERNAQMRARRLGVQQRLWMAERFADEEAIWFPHAMDFRGRVYPLPATGLHPQSDDAGKALLRFAEGKALGPYGGYWLAVHIANLFGQDKLPFDDRAQWAWDNRESLVDSARRPIDGNRFWITADSPWMALAAAIEFAGMIAEGEAFVSYLPIPLDGSNSGLQHFSALLLDPIGGAAVNLVPSDAPQDVYREVAQRAQEIVDASADAAAAPWRHGKVTRAIAKRPTMTFVYSATRYGMQETILETLRELDAENARLGFPPHLRGADNYAAAQYLSHVLFDAIGGVVSAAKGALDWLRAVAKIATKAGVALEWTTPDGLLVRQNYRVASGKVVKVHWRGRRIDLTLAVDGQKLDGRGQENGIAPNYVHSLDAAHLRAVARGAKAAGIDSLTVIHDSFGTHAADTNGLINILRDTFVAQYEPDHLADLYREVIQQLPEPWAAEIPAPPSRGTLNLAQVRASQYLFA